MTRRHLLARLRAPQITAVALAVAALACGQPSASPPEGAWVEIRGKRVEVEVVRGPREQGRGLSGRESLDWGSGMYFPYPRAGILRFWMKDMLFAIDIVFIREGRIVEVAHRVPAPAPGTPDSEIPAVQTRELADAVLEVPAGFAGAHGWRRGDPVGAQIPPRAPPTP